MADLIVSTLTQGLIYALLSYGVYITYSVLDFPDLTVDSSFPLGAAVTAILLLQGVNPWVTLLCAAGAGAIAGLCTGLIHVKLKVRDAVITYMKESMDEEIEGSTDAKDTKEWAKAHLEELEQVADRVIKKEGYSYQAEAEVTTCYFPDKRYGDILFPQGDYEALRIKLGKAQGHNWWCVLYPNLCFTNSTCAVVSDDGKEELKEALTAEEYEMVTATSDLR